MFEGTDGAKQAELELPYPPAQLEGYYRQMVFIRHFEEKTNHAFRSGQAGGYLHVYSGMEAIAVGWLNVIRQGYDYLIGAYRDHAYPLVLGTDPVRVMSEILGRSTGMSRGKGGSMHLYDIERQFYGGWGIVGGHTALGGGLALACKYRNEDRITLCILGDGAANAGVFAETLNMCGLWELPIVILIENNLYAMGTSLERHAAETKLYRRGKAFGIESERVDGQDLIQVLKDAKRITDYVRHERKPYLVEVMTYRTAGHGAADHDRTLYRTKEEEKEYAGRDPIKLYETYLEQNHLMTREKMEAIDAEALEEAERVYKTALEAPHPEESEVYADVYSDLDPEKGH